MSNSDAQYQIGQLDTDIPPYAPDVVMIQGYGSYSLSSTAFLNAGVPVNCASSLADTSGNYSAAAPVSDLLYLVQNDLGTTGVNKVVLVVNWVTPTGGYVVLPSVLPYEVAVSGVPTFAVGSYTRSSAYSLPSGSIVPPTIDDASFIDGASYLVANGYEIGVCPVNLYLAASGLQSVDRVNQSWNISQSSFTVFLGSYTAFVQHYCDLCVSNNLNPWIFYLGYGLWDLTFSTSDSYFQQWIETLELIANYVQTKLPNTLVTYAADLDEYFADYTLDAATQFRLDALWSSPAVDLIGINWFAPLALTYSNDPIQLAMGVTGNEEYSFLVSGYSPRIPVSNTDRLVTNSHQAGKTGFATTPISSSQGIKNIQAFLSYGHYVAPQPAVVSSPSPLPGNTLVSTFLSGPVIGTATTASSLGTLSTVGGLIPIPESPESTYLEVGLTESVFLSLPASFASPASFSFQFNYDISGFGAENDFVLCAFDYGLSLYYSEGNLTVSVPTTTVPMVYAITSAALGRVDLEITPTQVQVFIDDGLATTLTGTFTFPAPLEHLTIGDGTWFGNVFFTSINIVGNDGNSYGGNYYFEESYAGYRTSWVPGSSEFLITALGYPSISYGCVEPSTPIEVIPGTTPAAFPDWFQDVALYTSVSYANAPGVTVANIQGPYGSTFIVDEQHQAVCLSVAVQGIREAGAQYCVASFFDTRSGAGAMYQSTEGGAYLFNDALAFRYNHAQNSKATIRNAGSDLVEVLQLPTVDQLLGLSKIPSPPKRTLSVLSSS